MIGAAGNFVDGDDHTDEERKMMFETRKILEDEQIGVAVTCVRVPVRVSHSESVNLQTREPLSAEQAVQLLSAAPGITLTNVPSPLQAAGSDEVFVGRIRRDESHPRALSMWVVSDNLRKGAATNAVQIAELLAGGPRRGPDPQLLCGSAIQLSAIEGREANPVHAPPI